MKINAICHCFLANKVNRISLLWREALIESDVAGPSTIDIEKAMKMDGT